MDMHLILPAAALALDLLVGDPPSWPHPVRALGWAMDRLEPLAQGLSPAGAQLFGLACLLGLAGLSAGLVWGLCALPWVGPVFALYFAASGLGLGQLLREGKGAAQLIDRGDVAAARLAVSYLVSRDTSAMDRPALRRTLAETLSENISDGFVAPFFFLCLGGPALMWLYKAVSTMDSMWGYKTPRFINLGRAGALADDLLAFVPARLCAVGLVAAGWLGGLDAAGVLARTRADAALMASPNAGWPMAACAWLVGASMGGPAVYFGQTVEKPRLGPARGAWDNWRIQALLGLLRRTGVVLGLCLQGALIAWAVFS